MDFFVENKLIVNTVILKITLIRSPTSLTEGL